MTESRPLHHNRGGRHAQGQRRSHASAAVASLILGLLATIVALTPGSRLAALPLAVAGLALANNALNYLRGTESLAHLAAMSLPLNAAAAAIATIDATT